MTKQEFIDRTNIQISDEDFTYANRVYMRTDLDKDTFCAEWKKHKLGEPLTVVQLNAKIGTLENKVKELTDERSKMVDFLLEQSEKYSSAELRAQCIEMMGEREYLMRKIKMGYSLWDMDKTALVRIHELNR